MRETLGVPSKPPPAQQEPSRQPPDNPDTGIRPA
jgi:hypothetical protein